MNRRQAPNEAPLAPISIALNNWKEWWSVISGKLGWRAGKRFLPIVIASVLVASHSFAQSWPSLAKPAPAVGGGSHDAAVVVAIENYAFIAPIPGAKVNANAWYDYFVKTRRIPFKNVFRRIDGDATTEDIQRVTARAADAVGGNGTLWFVFIGHGAPSADGKDSLLVGVDTQAKAESLEARGLTQRRLLSTLTKSHAGTIVAVLDACFSGRGVQGSQLVAGLQPLVLTQAWTPDDPRMVVLTAAKGDEFAGQLPGVQRPAFSYLTLGGLRGWADEAGDGNITADEVRSYADSVLRTMVKDRTQTPVLIGDGSKLIALSAGEKGPDLAELAKQEVANPFQFKISALPEVPSANVPSISAEGIPSLNAPAALTTKAVGIDFGNVDVDALVKYNAAVNFEQGTGKPEDKAAKWRQLGAAVPAYAALATKRAQDWLRYAEESIVAAAVEFDKSSASPREKAARWRGVATKVTSQQETALKNAQGWDRYGAELVAIEKARGKRAAIRDADYAKLTRLLALSVVSASDKQNWAELFVKAYGGNCQDNPHITDIAPFLSSGTRSNLPASTCTGTPPPPSPSLVESTPGFSRGTMNLDLNYPGAGARYFLSGKTALEVRVQDDGGNLAAGARLYRYPALFPADSKFRPYLCAEGDYISFKGSSSKGSGWAGGGFAGIEYSLSRFFSLQMDTGGLYLALKDKSTSLTDNDFQFTLNFGVNFYIKSSGSPASSAENLRNDLQTGSEYDRVRERAEKAQEELGRQRETP